MERKPPKILNTNWIKSINDTLSIEYAISTEIYQTCIDYRSQCHILYELLHVFGFSKNKIAQLFGVDHKSFEKQLSLLLEPSTNGRPSILTDDEKRILFEKINEYHNKLKPTLYDIQQFVLAKIRKMISPDTLHNYIIDSELF